MFPNSENTLECMIPNAVSGIILSFYHQIGVLLEKYGGAASKVWECRVQYPLFSNILGRHPKWAHARKHDARSYAQQHKPRAPPKSIKGPPPSSPSSTLLLFHQRKHNGKK